MNPTELRRAAERVGVEISDEAADGSRLAYTVAFLPGFGWGPLDSEPARSHIAERLVAMVRERRLSWQLGGALIDVNPNLGVTEQITAATAEQRITAALAVLEG